MKTTFKRYLSLREIGRHLAIPPSTVVYYRDRFSKFIPFRTNPNGRCQYPTECLEIFKTIRRRFNQKRSGDQIEEELAAQYPEVPNPWGGALENGADTPSPGADNHLLIQVVTASMDKIANALDRHSALLTQLQNLQHAVNTLREEKQQADKEYREQLGRLKNELDRLKTGHQGKTESFRQAQSEHHRQDHQAPDPDFLANPLTVRYPPQRYLGIKDSRNAALNLNQLIEAMRSKASGSKAVAFSWQARGGTWTLTASLNSPDDGKDRKIILQAKATVTPQGNSVTEVVRMVIEGRELSKDDLLKFFKLYKAGMAGAEP